MAWVAELDFEVAGDIVDDRVGLWDVWVAGRAVGLETHAFEAFDGFFDRESELEGDGECSAEGLAHP